MHKAFAAAALAICVAASYPARAAEAPLLPKAAMANFCDGWAGNWKTEIDLTLDAGGEWRGSDYDPNWSVRSTGPGKCMFRFAGVDQFEIDTTQGYYDTTTIKDGKRLPVRRGVLKQAEVSGPRAWNVVLDINTDDGKPYRSQMTMAGDVFSIYLTDSENPGKPHALAVHRRVP